MHNMLFRAQQLLHRAAPITALFAATLIIVACGSGDAADPTPAPGTGGPPRPYKLGFSSLPRELNADAYEDAIDKAADNGEIMLVQRTIPWADFVPGAGISEDTAKNTAAERDKIEDTGVDLFFAIDLTDGATGRDRLADLPVSLAGKRFDDPDIRSAVVAYAEYVALNYTPQYLAIGVEMNLYYEENKQDFENFETLFAEAAAAARAKAPGMQVTVTFQYEDMLAILPRDDPHFPSWQLVTTFEPLVDLVAISTYPSFAFPTADALPPNYYSQLSAFTDKPIAIADMGFASEAGIDGINSGTDAEQEKYLRKTLLDAEAMSMPFVVWFAIWDPAYAAGTAFAPFRHIGLLTEDGREKPAWSVWQAVRARPIVTD